MSENVTPRAAAAFSNLVDAVDGSSDELIEMGKAIGYSDEEMKVLYSDLMDEEDSSEDEDEIVESEAAVESDT